ncbi:MAG: hypothetical protein ABIH89_10785 [Elusimicrobiota bacterium]
MKKNSYVYEALIIYAVIIALNYLFSPADPGFLDVNPSPFWIPIMLISARYGFIPGLVTGLTGAFIYLFYAIGGMPGREGISRLAETGRLLMPGYFIAAGAVTGSIRQKYIESEREKELALEKHIKRVTELEDEKEELEKSNRILESRIVGEAATFRTLYDSAMELEGNNLEQVLKGLLDILGKSFGVKKAAVYFIDGEIFALRSSSGVGEEDAVKSNIPVNDSIMKLALEAGKLLTVKDILEMTKDGRYASQYGDTLLLAPVRDSSGIIAVLNITEMDFYMLTKANTCMIDLLLRWIKHSIDKIEKYTETSSRLIKDELTGVYSYNYLLEKMPYEYAMAVSHKRRLALCVVSIGNSGILEDSAREIASMTLLSVIRNCMTEDEMLFNHKYAGAYILLAPFSGIGNIRDRLEGAGAEFMKILGNEKIPAAADPVFVFAEVDDYGKSYIDFISGVEKDTGLVFK